MGDLKYKVGDKVRINSFDWYDRYKNTDGIVHCGDKVFDIYMSVFCGSVVTIGGVYPYNGYDIREDMHCRTWTDEMIEGLAEEKNNDCEKCGLIHNSTRCLFMDNCPHNKQKNIIEIPDDYILKDENGNIINATKIVLEKKKKKYPKTFLGCCDVLGIEDTISRGVKGYKSNLLDTFQKLLICRDAYWKIAGEEMGLEKPWEPDYKKERYVISRYIDEIVKGYRQASLIEHFIFEFPTEEMRDAFFNAFRDDIEKCKELL